MTTTPKRLHLIAKGSLPLSPSELQALGVGIEFHDFMSPLVLDAPEEGLERYDRLFDEDFPRSMHGALFDLTPASPDPRIVEVTKLRYVQSLEVAHKLGAKQLILHSQINPQLMETFGEQIIAMQLDFWQEYLELAAEKDIVIMLENVFEVHPKFLIELLDRVNSPYLRHCLDVGHVLAYSTEPLECWTDKLGKYLHYMHLHETTKPRDDHRPPSAEFLTRVAKAIANLPQKPIVALEYHYEGSPLDEVQRVRDVLDC